LFGERFFATRERLSELIHGIHALAADAEARPAPVLQNADALVVDQRSE
jgi:hypothetical protein